ncbi:hypothetical protein ARMGADRAFT_1121578 [Armillaria gallica]|uniref:Uncharacterized protein n=1 Tax=Armillaria gallica TaxID=47427 RepID=A0A2H3DKD0_ARMGA|nr:hypothetical protein ARMGADRAFT_1121578 [Armillaria gallica]
MILGHQKQMDLGLKPENIKVTTSIPALQDASVSTMAWEKSITSNGEKAIPFEDDSKEGGTDQLADDSDILVHIIVHQELNIDVSVMSSQHGYCMEQIMDYDREIVADGEEEDIWALKNGEKLCFDNLDVTDI